MRGRGNKIINKGNDDLSAAFVRDILNYDPVTGVFTWRVTRANHVKAGSMVGSRGERGVVGIGIGGKRRIAHRLAWLWMTGSLPDCQIDHIDGNPANNVWSNLRKATAAQNRWNSRPCGKSGAKGVRAPRPKHSGWSAQVHLGGRTHHLGTFAASKLYGAFARLK